MVKQYRKVLFLIVLISFLLIISSTLCRNNLPTRVVIDDEKVKNECLNKQWIADGTFIEAIDKVANNKVVMVAIIDSGFLDMVINFYLTSIKAHGIKNYIMLAMDDTTCPMLHSHDIHCAMYHNFHLISEASQYGSTQFRAKMDVRAELLERVLCAGYSVLHVDTDMYFYSNPFLDINCQQESCHMICLVDGSEKNYNAGFIMLHPNKYSLYLYQSMQRRALSQPEQTEQNRLKSVLGDIKGGDLGFKFHTLSMDKYMSGKQYYNDRTFADTAPPCPQCVVVHNNWIIGMNEKIYRAKELQQWMYDKQGYYNSTSKKYLIYKNPVPVTHNTEDEQIALFKAALSVAHVLQRIVILPKFHCDGTACSLLNLISITELNKRFEGLYREHSFLTHPLVPAAVKHSVYNVSRETLIPEVVEDVWLKERFSHVTEQVMSFHTLCKEVLFTEDISHRLEDIRGKHPSTGIWKLLGF